MDEQGIVIFPNGERISFGEAVYADDLDYLKRSGHEESFKREILPNIYFKLKEFEYVKEMDFYENVKYLSEQGLILILNNKVSSDDPDTLIGYLAISPTEEQLQVIKNIIDTKEFDDFEKNLCEFCNGEKAYKYSNFIDYYNIKCNVDTIKKH